MLKKSISRPAIAAVLMVLFTGLPATDAVAAWGDVDPTFGVSGTWSTKREEGEIK